MGADIHSFVEVRKNGKWNLINEATFTSSDDKDIKVMSPFDWRSYSMFAFLAGVRNYDHCEPLSEPKGLPKDSEYLNETVSLGFFGEISRESNLLDDGYHSFSFLTLRELTEFDYDKTFLNRRISKQTSENSWNGASLAEEGEGTILSYRENLGELFFIQLNELKSLGEVDDVRIVFWFDS